MPVSVQPAPADASHQASEWPSCARRLLSAYHEMVDQECKRIIFVRFDTRYEMGLNNAAMLTGLPSPGHGLRLSCNAGSPGGLHSRGRAQLSSLNCLENMHLCMVLGLRRALLSVSQGCWTVQELNSFRRKDKQEQYGE